MTKEPLTIDTKFKFSAFNPFTGKYISEISGIVFCAHDLALIPTLEKYYLTCQELQCDQNQLEGIKNLITRVMKYQKENPTKIADISSDEEVKACLETTEL